MWTTAMSMRTVSETQLWIWEHARVTDAVEAAEIFLDFDPVFPHSPHADPDPDPDPGNAEPLPLSGAAMLGKIVAGAIAPPVLERGKARPSR